METNTLGYAIGKIFSKLTFEISSNEIVTKTDLC